MKPLFTIHEGEFLVGDYVTRKLSKRYDVWVPAKDSGVDLLLTPTKRNRKPVKLQVKFSRGFGAHYIPPEQLKARGFYTLDPQKIKISPADIWVFVILTLRKEEYYILVPTDELKKRIPRNCRGKWTLYLTVFTDNFCYNMRGVNKVKTQMAVYNGIDDYKRDYTDYLNNWKILDQFAK